MAAITSSYNKSNSYSKPSTPQKSSSTSKPSTPSNPSTSSSSKASTPAPKRDTFTYSSPSVKAIVTAAKTITSNIANTTTTSAKTSTTTAKTTASSTNKAATIASKSSTTTAKSTANSTNKAATTTTKPSTTTAKSTSSSTTKATTTAKSSTTTSKPTTSSTAKAGTTTTSSNPKTTSKFDEDKVANAVAILASKNTKIKIDSKGNPISNNQADKKKFWEEYNKLKKKEAQIVAAAAAGISTCSNGDPRINSAYEAKAYMEAYNSVSAKLAYKNDIRYKKLSDRVNSWDNIEPYKKEFVMEVFPIILKYEDETGVPAEIIFGQMCSESAYGTETLTDKYTGKEANNYFGVKGNGPAGSVTCDTTEFINGKRVLIEAEFKAYNNMDEAIKDYSNVLNRNYKKYTTTGTPEDWANALVEGGYATAPNYGEAILGVSKTWRIYE